MPKAYTIQEKKAMALEKMAETVTTEKSSSGRKRRAAFSGTESKMEIDHVIPGFHLHWLNDYAGRIQQAIQGGYDFVTADEVGGLVNSNVTDRNSDLGEKVRMLVGQDEKGGPLYAYLMKIPVDFYEEDQKALQARNDLVDEAIRNGKPPGVKSEGFYDGGIKMS